jgi:hypothetical protein
MQTGRSKNIFVWNFFEGFGKVRTRFRWQIRLEGNQIKLEGMRQAQVTWATLQGSIRVAKRMPLLKGL